MPFPPPESIKLKTEYDFVIVGSGGGSMAAALYAKRTGLNPVILEKRDVVGGSTGFSGGVWWVPDNHVMKAAGVHETREMAERYMDAVATFKGKGTTSERRKAFLDEAPEMIRFLADEGMEYYYPDGWADYYDNMPGGQSRGRSLMAQPFDRRELGPWQDRVSLYEPYIAVPLPAFVMMKALMFKRTWASKRIMMRLAFEVAKNKVLGRKIAVNGAAIQSRMLEMTLKRGIPVITGFATDRLIEEDGRIVAVEGEYKGGRTQVRSRFDILMNVGGFARKAEMRKKYQRQPISHTWTNANPGDTGEMLEEMIRVGGDTENLDLSVWVPTSLNPDGSLPDGAIAADGKAYPFMHNADGAVPIARVEAERVEAEIKTEQHSDRRAMDWPRTSRP